MKHKNKKLLDHVADSVRIPSDDMPDIELYMDQVTTFMNTHLESTKRYPDDKILTKTMINNYTKNKLLPPSVRKKYSKDHLFMLIFIYYLKNVLSISDIQTLLGPVSDRYFGQSGKAGPSLKEIYDQAMDLCSSRDPAIQADLRKVYEETEKACSGFSEAGPNDDYLSTFSFLYQLCYDIYVRKQLIERIIDDFREEAPPEKKGKRKATEGRGNPLR